MKDVHDPNKVSKKLECHSDKDDYLEESKDVIFNVGQSYEQEPAVCLKCKNCGATQFNVGQGDYFTALKCINCQYEVCIHDG